MIEHHRRSIRLPEYDYSQPGEYFITLVSYGRSSIFGKIDGERVRLSPFGEIARDFWKEIPIHFPFTEIGPFVVMPNHFHGIIHIVSEIDGRSMVYDQGKGTACRAPTPTTCRAPTPTTRRAPTPATCRAPTPATCRALTPTTRRAPTPTPTNGRAPTDGIERFGKPVSGSIPTIVRAYKSAVTKRINELRGTPSTPVWQRNYYEHIITTDDEYATIAAYIESNPVNWARDDENIGP